MSTVHETASTRQRLLLAAAQVFADQGFDGASVRDICARAEANVAAINYHFGGKEELFTEVLKLPLKRLEESIAAFSEPALPLSEALRRMYLGVLAPLRSGSVEAAAMRAMVRSMSGKCSSIPHPDEVVLHRHHAALADLVTRHLPPTTTPEAASLASGALIGMAMHAVMGQMSGGNLPRMWSGSGDAAVDELAAHLARYGAAIIATESRS